MAKVITAPDMGKCIGCYSCMLACARELQKTFSPQYAALRIHTRGGLQSKMTADICRACAEPPCAESCGYKALTPRKGGGVKLDEARCTGCGDCVPACPIGYIQLNPAIEKIVMCSHCGICAKFCPHGVLELAEVKHDV
ncbi:MAG: 4Fe-4S binding protein [Solirubrobacterales bacterium]